MKKYIRLEENICCYNGRFNTTIVNLFLEFDMDAIKKEIALQTTGDIDNEGFRVYDHITPETIKESYFIETPIAKINQAVLNNLDEYDVVDWIIDNQNDPIIFAFINEKTLQHIKNCYTMFNVDNMPLETYRQEYALLVINRFLDHSIVEYPQNEEV